MGTIGVVLLTTVAGGGAALAVANFLIYWQQIPSREGAAGYFAVFVTAMGLVGGFVVGLITALVVRSGFWRAQGYALAAVVLLALVGTVLPLLLDDQGPKLDGDKLVLEVELKCPRGWKPDNYAKSGRGSFCWLQKNAADGPRETNPIELGGLILKDAPEADGQWVVTCAVDLTKTRKGRFLRVFVGHKTDVAIRVPLPARPSRRDKEWNEWEPVSTDYVFRCRVQGDTEYRRQHPDPNVVFEEARQKAVAAMPPDAPLADWLRFFEDGNEKPTAYTPGEHPEVEAVRARPLELVPLLRSSDRNVARRAVFAAATLEQTPAALIEPLAVAGRLTIELIRDARAGALPKDPDLAAEDRAYTHFFYWGTSMEHAGTAGARLHRRVLEEIERETRDSAREGGIHLIGELARKELDKLGPAS